MAFALLKEKNRHFHCGLAPGQKIMVYRFVRDVKPVQIKKVCCPFRVLWDFKRVFHIIDENRWKSPGTLF